MKAAVIIIFLAGIFLGFWLMYEVVKYTQGEKIKAYYDQKKKTREADKLHAELEKQRRLAQLERHTPELVDVEDLGIKTISWDIVKEGKRHVPTDLVIEISNMPTVKN